ncbi:GlcG/HbpS family heme-binding protein [Leptolyngbya sp. AN02str]|uniref:GlcG/HbpS family heme-binding protein n=1 Tax=Leptolyngbya sp. AN02str TaxID=3423363 RepID=UPI003D320F88
MYTRATQELTHAGAMVVLQGAIAKAEEMGVPQCIAIVDTGGNLLAFVRMDGAKVLSQLSATNKAVTAASSRVPTGGVDADVEARLAFATDGKLTNLKGGLPITIGDQIVGAIGVGSGTGAQDVEVGQAGIAALHAAIAAGA